MPKSSDAGTNRKEMTVEELPLQARLRLENSGKWVVWNETLSRIVAAGDDPLSVRAAADEAGERRGPIEWLPPFDQAWPCGGL